jgi:hypothetical protein
MIGIVMEEAADNGVIIGTLTAEDIADAMIAAGYRKPRTVSTKEEIEALPDEAVIRDSAGDVAEKRGGVWCSYETAPMTSRQLAKYTPLDVLSEPAP